MLELEARPSCSCWQYLVGQLVQVGDAEELKQLVTEGADALSAKSKKERFAEQSWDSLKSTLLYEVLREYKGVLPDDIPAATLQDKGVQHEIDFVPGTKYRVTRQWPLPREQVKAIDDFFESRRKAGQVREFKSPHSAQTPTPRQDVIIDSMAWSTVFSALDLREGFYQILMRESDIPLTAVSTPSGMLWEWLVMPQGLKNSPATFNRCVTHLLRSVRDFAPTPSSSLLDDVRSAYANDADAKRLLNYFAAPSDKSCQKLAKHLRARVHRYREQNGLLLYSAVDDNADQVVVPDDHKLKLRITYEYHDAPTSGHPGREQTYLLLTRDFYWSHQYKWVRKYVRACEVCQRVKPAPLSQAPLQALPTPSECWQSISMDFIFGLPPGNKRRTGIVVFVDRFSEMVHLAAVPAEVTAKPMARLFVDMVFRHHGMPIDIVSDRDPRFTSRFWQEVFTLLVLVDALKSYAHSFHQWSDCLPMAEFAINNSVHVSTGYTPFYVNAMRHLRVPSVLGAVAPSSSGGGYPVSSKPNKHADMSNISAVSTRARTTRSPIKESPVSTPGVDTLTTNEQHMQGGPVVNKDVELNPEFSSKTMDFVQRRKSVLRFVQDAITTSVDRQKLNADNNGRHK
ncbi:unnamed protein product [Phytophthora fragariaefolia]|uniref:Unnamed protein product n=1 Tax=Phytophthora fragariaefolia TaxID=1490495 RepID=A0A9W6YMS7_9STRA|nr:unnamed protein product [Phytophthora fragariaefolia]